MAIGPFASSLTIDKLALDIKGYPRPISDTCWPLGFEVHVSQHGDLFQVPHEFEGQVFRPTAPRDGHGARLVGAQTVQPRPLGKTTPDGADHFVPGGVEQLITNGLEIDASGDDLFGLQLQVLAQPFILWPMPDSISPLRTTEMP